MNLSCVSEAEGAGFRALRLNQTLSSSPSLPPWRAALRGVQRWALSRRRRILLPREHLNTPFFVKKLDSKYLLSPLLSLSG